MIMFKEMLKDKMTALIVVAIIIYTAVNNVLFISITNQFSKLLIYDYSENFHGSTKIFIEIAVIGIIMIVVSKILKYLQHKLTINNYKSLIANYKQRNNISFDELDVIFNCKTITIETLHILTNILSIVIFMYSIFLFCGWQLFLGVALLYVLPMTVCILTGYKLRKWKYINSILLVTCVIGSLILMFFHIIGILQYFHMAVYINLIRGIIDSITSKIDRESIKAFYVCSDELQNILKEKE